MFINILVVLYVLGSIVNWIQLGIYSDGSKGRKVAKHFSWVNALNLVGFLVGVLCFKSLIHGCVVGQIFGFFYSLPRRKEIFKDVAEYWKASF